MITKGSERDGGRVLSGWRVLQGGEKVKRGVKGEVRRRIWLLYYVMMD